MISFIYNLHLLLYTQVKKTMKEKNKKTRKTNTLGLQTDRQISSSVWLPILVIHESSGLGLCKVLIIVLITVIIGLTCKQGERITAALY